MRVYVAGPMTKGPLEANVRLAVDAGAVLMSWGFHPFIPHVYVLMQMIHPQHYERWMELDFAFIKVCDALYRLPGESAGADREVEYARKKNIPVFHDITSLIEWRNGLQASVRELATDLSGVVAPKV